MKWFVGLVILLGLAGWSYYSYTRPEEKTEYITAKVVRSSIVEVVSVTGYAEPMDEGYVQAELPGIIAEIAPGADYNQTVEKGQVLAKLSSERERKQKELALLQRQAAEKQVAVASAQIEAANAGLEMAKAKSMAAQRNANTQSSLSASGISANEFANIAEDMKREAAAGVVKANSDIKSAVALFSQAQQQIEVANLRVQEADLVLSKTEIKSPITGIIIGKNIRIGDTVGRPQINLMDNAPPALFVIAAPFARMRAIVKISESDVSRVEPGQPVTFSVDAYPNKKFKAVLNSIRPSPSSDRTAISYPAVLEFDNEIDPKTKTWMIRPKATVVADIEVGRAVDVLSIPSQAANYTPTKVFESPSKTGADKRILWKLGVDNKPVPVVVQVGISGPRIDKDTKASGNGSSETAYIAITSENVKVGEEFIVAEPAKEKKETSIPFL